ncbi:hypothetical protein C0J52_22703 [Blattella germanica]|nr:hypothetical protein C0J52_22703 [Blattella germanica]
MLSDHELRKLGKLTAGDCILARSCAAKSLINNKFMTESSNILQSKWQRLSVGCKKLDEFLGGGIPVRGITEIAGESGSGKTQLCLQMTLTVQYPISDGGLDGGAVYICTEDAFPSRRLQELFQTFPPTFKKFEKNANFSDNIFIEHIGDAENLKQCLWSRLPQLLTHRKIKLLIIDSIAGVFRAEYDVNNAINRAKDLQMIGTQLHKLADKFQLAVICVNQVSDVISDEAKQKSVPSLGLAWANLVTSCLQISRTAQTIVDSHQSVTVRTLDVEKGAHAVLMFGAMMAFPAYYKSILPKQMFPVQATVRAAPSVCRALVQTRGVTRNANVVSTPGRVHIPFAEKLAHGLLIAGGLLFTPAWVLTHLKNYQAHD